MKNKIKTILQITGLFLLSAGILAGCLFEPPAARKAGKGKGTLALSIQGGGARTMLPDWDDVTYNVKITPQAGGAAVFDEEDAGSYINLDLSVGTYTITIEAVDGGDEVIGDAQLEEVEITAGGFKNLTAIIVPKTGGANGTLEWDIKYPEGVTVEFFGYIAEDGDVDEEDDWEDLDIEDPNATLPAGTYLVRIKLEGDAGKTGDIDAVHIYSGKTTKLEWEFSATGLISPRTWTGTLAILFTDTLTGIDGVEAVFKAAGMDNVPATVDYDDGTEKYIITADIPKTITDVKAALTITTENNVLETELDADDGSVADDVVDFDFDDIQLYTLSFAVDTNGDGTGTLLVNGATLQDGDKMDFIDGDNVAITAIANPANRFTGMEVGGIDTGGVPEFTIDAIDANVEVTAEFADGLDPNVLFEWRQAVDPWPIATANGATTTNAAGFSVAAAYPDILVAKNSANVGKTQDGENGAPYGGVWIQNGNMSFGSAVRRANTAAGNNWKNMDDTISGQLDLSSRKFRITLSYKDVASTTGQWLRILLNNNTTGQANSALLAYSRLTNFTFNMEFPTVPTAHSIEGGDIPAGDTARQTSTYRFLPGSSLASGTLIVEVDPVATYGADAGYETLTNAFVGILVPSGATSFVLTSLKIEYIEDTIPALSAVKIYNDDTAALVSGTTITMKPGDPDINLVAQFVPASLESAPTVTWESDDTDEDYVGFDTDTGKVSAKDITPDTEPVTITATAGSISASVAVEVTVPSLDLKVLDGATEVGASISLEFEDTVTLTANTGTEIGATFAWEVSGTSASLDTTSGDTVVITASDTVAGNTVIKVTASKDGFADTERTITVRVTDPNAGTDPNLIFEWNAATNGEPSGMVWTNGADAAGSVSTAELTGSLLGKYTAVPVSIASGGANNNGYINYVNADATKGTGIRFDMETANARILVIGADFGRSVTTTGPTHRAGVFDFLTAYPDGKTKIQVTLVVDHFTGGAGNLSLTINNNTTTGGDCPLTPTQGGGARVIYHATPDTTNPPTGNNGVGTWDGGSGTMTYVSRAFAPGDFTAGSATLETAFLALGYNSVVGATFTITSIKIEYVD